MDYTSFLSQLALRRKPSAIRALAAFAQEPGMLNMSGGYPNASLFPSESAVSSPETPLHTIELTQKELSMALQYTSTPGYAPLRVELEKLQTDLHGVTVGDNACMVHVSAGAQEGLSKVFQALVNPGDVVLTGNPTYPGALAALRPLQPQIQAVDTDEFGIIPEALEATLAAAAKANTLPKLLYVIPSCQNPSGATLPEERRRFVAEKARQYNFLILEDDPYFFLSPTARHLPSLLRLAPERTIRLDSFSKLLFSGLRVGFMTGPAALITAVGLHIQSDCLHPSTLSQVLLHRILQKVDGLVGLDVQAARVRQFYAARATAAVAAATKAGLSAIAPDGGMFLWMRLPRELTQDDIQPLLVGQKVLAVPGQVFDPHGNPSPYLRVSFSQVPQDHFNEAFWRLARVIESVC